MTDFYMQCNAGLRWVSDNAVPVGKYSFKVNSKGTRATSKLFFLV